MSYLSRIYGRHTRICSFLGRTYVNVFIPRDDVHVSATNNLKDDDNLLRTVLTMHILALSN